MARRTRVAVAALLVAASILPPGTSIAAPVPPFSDIDGHPFEADIEWLRQQELTTGCGGGRFCPNASVTRAEMASFLVRAFELPPTNEDPFTDDEGSWAEDDINRLAAAGVTTGCTATTFCPGSSVTRQQMASFLGRALELPSAVRDYFADDDRSVHQTDINRLAESGITGGCGGVRFCIGSATTRGQMAAFLHRALTWTGGLPACDLFPATNVWNRTIDHLPVAADWSGWQAGSGAIWDLASNALRPDGWTSADAAGLPILPGLVRYEEVASGAIEHAIRFTAPVTRSAHIYPARHHAGAGSSAAYPPMGLRVRLKASFDISGFGPQAQVILVAMKRYGMILADNGSPWYFTGSSDIRWDDDQLNELKSLRGSDFEVVDTTGFVNGP